MKALTSDVARVWLQVYDDLAVTVGEPGAGGRQQVTVGEGSHAVFFDVRPNVGPWEMRRLYVEAIKR